MAMQVKEKVKSMLAAKSFDAATSDVAAIKRWFRVLGEELCDRMLNDYSEHHRHPRTLSLSYRSQPPAISASLPVVKLSSLFVEQNFCKEQFPAMWNELVNADKDGCLARSWCTVRTSWTIWHARSAGDHIAHGQCAGFDGLTAASV